MRAREAREEEEGDVKTDQIEGGRWKFKGDMNIIGSV